MRNTPKEEHRPQATPHLGSMHMGTTRKRRGVETKPFYADIRPEHKDKFDALAEATGVRKNVLFEEIIAHVEVDEHGIPTWWERPLTSDQQEELRLTG